MNRKGFTLIEFVIVLAIVIILTAAAIHISSDKAHGMEFRKPMEITESNLKLIAGAVRNDTHQLVTVMVYSATWTADNAGFKEIDGYMVKKNQVLVDLARLGISGGRINLLLANKGGLESVGIEVPAKDGVYIFLE